MKTPYLHPNQLPPPPPPFAKRRTHGLSSALLRQTLSGRSAALLALIAALSIFLAYVPTAHAQSSDATLRSLTLQVDGQPLTLDPVFSSVEIAYTASVAGSVPWLTVTPTASNPGVNITVNTTVLSSAITVNSAATSPLLLLNTGDNTIEIVVTAADGVEVTADDSSTTYTVTVTRRNDAGCGASTGIIAAHARLLAECATLLGLKDELRGAAALNWAANVNITSWDGITISGNRVHHIDLRKKGLAGVIPSELGSLSNLTRLYLNINRLTGQIPKELGRLTNLERLWLDINRLDGAIPPELGNLSNLKELWLDTNQLDGAIPPELGNLSNLTILWLNKNRLTGAIPPELGRLTNLTHLLLHCNRLTGGIPTELNRIWRRVFQGGVWLQGNPLDSVVIPMEIPPPQLYTAERCQGILEDSRLVRAAGVCRQQRHADGG